MRKSLLYTESFIHLLENNPMVHEHYPDLSDMLVNLKAGLVRIMVSDVNPHSCSSCLSIIATPDVGRKVNWPNYCPNCGKQKQDVGGTCTRPLYA
jgi:predicted RNA-binding Zn-ribbon protein involved in translation (DUF1610 family)